MGVGTFFWKYKGKKPIEIKLGLWDNARKDNVKRLLEIKLGFWDNVR